jgi:hypothetical protein
MAKVATLALPLGWRHATDPDCLPTGILGIDFPRGRISEITGPASSGRTSLLDSLLAAATSRGEHCVLIDTRDSFDPPSAAAYGVRLEKLVWIRCRGNAEHALRAADLVLHSGGFGVVALDLADVPATGLNRIPPTAWFRFRRVVEPTPTIFAVLSNRPVTKSCSTLLIETRRRRIRFLRDSEYEIDARKPMGKEPVKFHVRLHSLAAG